MVACAVLFIVLQVWLELEMPDYMTKITILLQSPNGTTTQLLHSGGRMLLCALGSLAASVLVSIFVARIATSFGATLRRRLFSRVQTFSMEEIGKFSTASLITRSTNDITQVQLLIVMGLQGLVRAPIMAAWAIGKIAMKNWQWTLSTAISVGLLLLLITVGLLLVMPRFRKTQKLLDSLNRVTRENLTGLRVVRAYNAEAYQQTKFDKANAALTDNQLRAQRILSSLMPGIQCITGGLTLSIYWIGAFLLSQSVEKTELFANMMTYLSYAMQVLVSFMLLVVVFITLPRASVSARRIHEVLDTVPHISDGTRTEGKSVGEVEFRNVSFRYPDAQADALSNISFRAKKGETVALIGATGSGKSTLLQLIPRFYDATQGEVLVNGVNVREYTQKALRDKIGFVSQKAVLFSGTVAENIAADASREAIRHALSVAQADFIRDCDSRVAQGGANFSGGQKQRLSIARAICRKPEILIFDDSFSALDYRTDRSLRKCLREECREATKLIVAQRIGTIRDADCILVLDEGRQVGQGTHAELMRSCEVYRQIARSQLSKEELQ